MNDSLTFTQVVTNDAGGQINAINSTLNFQAGLTNGGQLNLINTTILGSVSGSVGGAASFVGDNSVGGNLAMAAGDSLAIRLGGTAPAQFDSLAVGGDATLTGSLSVSLMSGFTLEPEQSFTIIDIAGAASGSFAALAEGAPVGSFNGTDLFITYAGGNGNDVALFTVAPGLSGDFNLDGSVDAADYVLWHANPGGIYTPDDYNTWRAHFGSGAALGSDAAVPEPASLVLLVLALSATLAARGRGAGGRILRAARRSARKNGGFCTAEWDPAWREKCPLPMRTTLRQNNGFARSFNRKSGCA